MKPSPPLPSETEQRLRSELNNGEKLLWTGQPLATVARPQSLPLVVLGVPWTAFGMFLVVLAGHVASQASSSSEPSAFNKFWLLPLCGVPFVLSGLWMLSAPYWMRRKAKKTVYALTDKRALILTPTWRGGITVRSLGPEHLTTRKRMTNPDGSGTIVFPALTTLHRAAIPEGGMYAENVGFENIADVRDVEALMEKTYRASE